MFTIFLNTLHGRGTKLMENHCLSQTSINFSGIFTVSNRRNKTLITVNCN